MSDIPADLREKLTARGLDPANVARVVETALAEDLPNAGSDVTTLATIPPGKKGKASVVARVPGVIAGLQVAQAVFELVGGRDGSADPVQGAAASIVPADLPSQAVEGLSMTHHIQDGARVQAGQALATVQGSLRAILTAERTALNLLGH